LSGLDERFALARGHRARQPDSRSLTLRRFASGRDEGLAAVKPDGANDAAREGAARIAGIVDAGHAVKLDRRAGA
jgi:hypothetical protein